MDLNVLVPEPPPPGGKYDSVRIAGGIAYVAVQFPFSEGKLAYKGRLGLELTTAEGYEAARLCALNVLAQMKKYVGLDKIAGLNTIDAKMLTHGDWDDFPKVLDGASALFLEILGDAGRHSRSLSGAFSLPMNSPIALTASFTLNS